MDRALYINGETEKTINAYDINRKEYQDIYKGKLFCIEDECNAIMVHTDKQKGGISRYFSTKPKSKHKEGCPNEIFHDGTKASIRRTSTTGINITDEHKRRVLNEAYKQFLESLNPPNTKGNNINTKKKKKKTSPKTDDDESTIKNSGGVPIVDGSGKDIEGNSRPPYVYKREVSELKNDDIGTTKEVHGFVESIDLFEDEVNINLIGTKGEKISLFIGNPFKVSYEQEFRYLSFFNEYLIKKKSGEQIVVCNSIGLVKNNRDKVVVEIYDYKDIRFDGQSLYQIRQII